MKKLLSKFGFWLYRKNTKCCLVGLAKEDIKKGDLVMFDEQIQLYGKANNSLTLEKGDYYFLTPKP